MDIFTEMPWHRGEREMQEMMHVDYRENPSVPYLSSTAAVMLNRYRLLAFGTLDGEGRPWTTLWSGVAMGLQQSNMAIKVPVDAVNDPVVEALLGNKLDAGVCEEGLRGTPFSALSIDLETRRRVKVAGTVSAGALTTVDEDEDEPQHAQAQIIAHVDWSLGNCPKYLNKKHISRQISVPKLLSQSAKLSLDSLRLIAQADLFFLSSVHSGTEMDTNHRGGPAGFVRTKTEASGASTIIWPEYSGNNLYQSLGNLVTTPIAGIVFPDFNTGDVLYVTGSTKILVGSDAAKVMPASNLAVQMTVTDARHVQAGLHFRGKAGEASPYNPRVRKLATETKGRDPSEEQKRSAKLLKVTSITSDIARFKFRLLRDDNDYTAIPIKAGQWVALDFSSKLQQGYSHMRDADPTSLNDDYVRTFTVSSAPAEPSLHADEFELTLRKVGRVTKYLFEHDVDRTDLDVIVQGFGGEFVISGDEPGLQFGFFASGVGITPLLSALPSINMNDLTLAWTVRPKDLPLVEDTVQRYPALALRTRLFVTGDTGSMQDPLRRLKEKGMAVNGRRIHASDLQDLSNVNKWYMCATPALLKQATEWLRDKEVIYEDFGF